jgi:hypothetical protein
MAAIKACSFAAPWQTHLKRAERAMQTIRDQAELPPETADALQELVDVVRNIEGRCQRWKTKDLRTQQRQWLCQTGNDNELKKTARALGGEALAPSKFEPRVPGDNRGLTRLIQPPKLKSFRIASTGCNGRFGW